MTADRHERLGRLFLEASRLPPEERGAFLARRCGDDPSLRGELESMLSVHEQDSCGLDTPILSRTLQASLLSEPEQAAQPIAIGGYRILRVLGVGGMGVVYLAEQERPRRTIALKVIKPGMASPTLLRRFELEQEVLGRLQHPGIAQIFEAGVHKPDGTENRRQWQPYFAMELVEGLPLAEYCSTHRLPPRERLALLVKICDAVQHAHMRGVIHRDLKPANILVDVHGQPKVLDFGVARSTGSDIQVTTLHTDVGQLVGTLPYMSPEQVAGDPTQIDTRSDVYSLGVMCYELLTGRLPHDVKGRSIPEAARIIIDIDPQKMSSVDRTLRGDLDTLVAKALEKDKSRRYQSAAELGADIERYLRDEPIVARPPSRTYQVAKFAKRNKPLVAGLALAFLFLLVGLASTTYFMLQFLDQRNAAQDAEIVANQQRNMARDAEAKANHRFDELHRFATTIMHDIYDEVMILQGSTKAREKIITHSQRYLDSLANEVADNPKLQVDLAEAYSRLGDVLGAPDRPNLGDFEGAMRNYEKAEQIRLKLLESDPERPQYRRGITFSLNSIGRMLEVQNKPEEALERYQKSLAIRDQLVAEQPNSIDAQRDLSVIRQWIGNVHLSVGRFPEAHEQYVRQLETARQLVTLAPEDPKSPRDLGVALEKVGDVLRKMERFEESLPYYVECVALRRTLFDANPHSAEAMEDLAIGTSKQAELYISLKRLDEALQMMQESFRALKLLVDADPKDVKARRNLIVTHYKLSLAYAAIGADESRPVETRIAAYRESALSIDRGLEMMNTLRNAGRLGANMADWPDEFSAARRSAVDALTALGGEAPAIAPATSPTSAPATGPSTLPADSAPASAPAG